MIPLNQSYRIQATLDAYPELKRIYEKYLLFIKQKTDFPATGGRAYDFAMAMHTVTMMGMDVCEVGSRGSFLPPFLLPYVNEYHASDFFQGWGDFGDMACWKDKWERNSGMVEKLHVSTEDMRHLTYPDNRFDVVMSFSSIEHIRENGDIVAAREMGRVCKPGGFVIIGTDMAQTHCQPAGYCYDEESLFTRIIRPTGCELVGPYDFSWGMADHYKHRTIDEFEYTSCIFVLQKPKEGDC